MTLRSVLIRFIADCLEMPALHCYADPLAGLTANILEPGQQFSWHFDTNDVAVTVLVDPADEGGLFEYAPAARTATDENFDGIQRILEGDLTPVRTLDLRPGDLQIFRVATLSIASPVSALAPSRGTLPFLPTPPSRG